MPGKRITSRSAGKPYSFATVNHPRPESPRDAPTIGQFSPLSLSVGWLYSIEIGLHTQFVGEILNVKADDSVCDERDMSTSRK